MNNFGGNMKTKRLDPVPFGYLPNVLEYKQFTSGYYLKLTCQVKGGDEHRGPMAFTLDCCIPKPALNSIIDLLQGMVDSTAGNIVKTSNADAVSSFRRKAKDLGMLTGDNRTQEVKPHENQG